MNRVFCLGGFLVAISATASFGQTFTEAFEGGIPATWTIEDNFPLPGVPAPLSSAVPWTVNTAEGMANYTGGTGLAATASSFNHPGQYDISLITPSFQLTSALGGNELAYTINYHRVDAFEAFDTNLSVNGGPWTTMLHTTTPQGPPYGFGPPKVSHAFNLNLFGAATGDFARVEFRYYSTFLLPMVRNQYVEIDNVRTPSPVPEPLTSVSALFAAMLWSLWRRRALR